MIIKKTEPLIALLIGTLLAAIFAIIFQPEIVLMLSGGKSLNFANAYKGVLNAITTKSIVQLTTLLLQIYLLLEEWKKC